MLHAFQTYILWQYTVCEIVNILTYKVVICYSCCYVIHENMGPYLIIYNLLTKTTLFIRHGVPIKCMHFKLDYSKNKEALLVTPASPSG